MNFCELAAELFAFAMEGYILFSAVAEIGGKREMPARRYRLIFAGCLLMEIMYAFCMTALNKPPLFIAAVIYILVINAAFALSPDSFLTRATAGALASLWIFFINNFTGFLIIYMMGATEFGYGEISILMSSGRLRILYLLCGKTLLFICWLLMRPRLQGLRILRAGQKRLLLLVTLLSYVTIHFLQNMAAAETPKLSGAASLLIGAIILICLCAVVASLVMAAQYRQETYATQRMNAILERSYAETARKATELYSQAHDFKNHLRVIRSLEPAKAQAYIDDLLKEASGRPQHCHSADQYVNAIINCKISEAARYQIAMSFSTQLSAPVRVASTDICAILSNQLDNAIEACRKIPDIDQRQIRVTVEEKAGFVAFVVENRIVPGSLDPKSAFSSTKPGAEGAQHGFGIHNIEASAKKYGGTLKNRVEKERFISVVVIPL